MSRPLYLDSARLGQFSINARRTLTDFLDLVGEAPTHPQLIEWLRNGGSFAKDFESLSRWQGIDAFEQTITEMFGAPATSRACMSSRSVTLIRLGLQQLFKRCRRCMTVDTCWPRYLHELHQAAARKSDSVFVKSFRRPVYDRSVSVEELCENLCFVYCAEGCDGLFLPAVDYMGTRLPIAEIVRAIRKFGGEVRFILVDAAQALGHVPLQEDCAVADYVVAGTHKWLGSYSTLGIGIAPHPRDSVMDDGIQNSVRGSYIDDGLLAFIEQLRGSFRVQSETVNLCPLFSAFGAMEGADPPTTRSVSDQLHNAEQVMCVAEQSGWNAVLPSSDFRSGILLLQLPNRNQNIDAGRLQQVFLDHSVFLTAYDGGLIRISLPTTPLSVESLNQLGQACCAARSTAGTERRLAIGFSI